MSAGGEAGRSQDCGTFGITNRTTRPGGALVDAVAAGRIRHLAQAELDAALRGAATGPAGGESWAFRQRSSDADITPLLGAVRAHWLASQPEFDAQEGVGIFGYEGPPAPPPGYASWRDVALDQLTQTSVGLDQRLNH